MRLANVRPATVRLLPLALVVLSALGCQSKSEEIISPKRGPMVEAIYGLGKVKSRRHFEVKIGTMDRVEKLYVREGDRVKPGDPLIKFLETQLFRTPIEGVITSVLSFEGEPATPQTPIVRVEDTNNKYIEVALEQQAALRVKPGLSAEVVFESLRSEKHKAKVVTLFSRNDEFLAHLEVEGGLKDAVLSGMTADVAITVAEKPEVLMIPVTSISNGHVTVIKEGKKQKIPVRIGGVDGQWAEVLEPELTVETQLVNQRKK